MARPLAQLILNRWPPTRSRRHLFQRAVLSISPIPKVLCFWRRYSQFIMPQQPQLMRHIVLGVTTIVVDIIVMIGYATPCSTGLLYGLKGPKQMKALE